VLELRHAHTMMATGGAITTYMLALAHGGPTCSVCVPSCND